jgi:flagellar hook-basal body complex protein FliE
VDSGAISVPAGVGGGEGPSFGDTLKQFIGGVSEAQDAAGELRDKFLRGEGVELHQMMAASEEASIALETMVELRNKVTEAYKTLVNMQG